jgi:hypothetical protein
MNSGYTFTIKLREEDDSFEKTALRSIDGIALLRIAQDPWNREGEISTDSNSYIEFVFTRIIFNSGCQLLPESGNKAWRDWPHSDMHFIRGTRRLTVVDIED